MEAQGPGSGGGEIPDSRFGSPEQGLALTVELSARDTGDEDTRGPQVCPEGSEVGCTVALGLLWGEGTCQICLQSLFPQG